MCCSLNSLYTTQAAHSLLLPVEQGKELKSARSLCGHRMRWGILLLARVQDEDPGVEKLWMYCSWRCSRLGWMVHWATWSRAQFSSWQHSLWQEVGTKWSLRSLPTQIILWFYRFGLGTQSRAPSALIFRHSPLLPVSFLPCLQCANSQGLLNPGDWDLSTSFKNLGAVESHDLGLYHHPFCWMGDRKQLVRKPWSLFSYLSCFEVWCK